MEPKSTGRTATIFGLSEHSRVGVAAALAVAAVGLGTQPVRAQATTRVSVHSSGAQAAERSFNPMLSADGRFTVFESFASNLVTGDTNSVRDVFVHDRGSGATERASVDSAGAQQGLASWFPSISADGRYVAFTSAGPGFVAGDTNSATDIFVRDRASGTTERVSLSTSGAQGDHQSVTSSLSADGRFVAFDSFATNLVAGDTNASWDIFVRDRANGTTERVSLATGGAQSDWDSDSPSISADGRFVAFESVGSNLVPGDVNGRWDVFVRDRLAGTTERVSVGSGGAEGDSYSQFPCISADGRWVAFESYAGNLINGDMNAVCDIFLHDRLTATTERVSVDSAGAEGNSDSRLPSISGEGRFVTFASNATNLVPGDTNLKWDIFVRDCLHGTTARVSIASSGSSGADSSEAPAISADGRFIAFESLAPNLVAGDTNAFRDVFLRDTGPPPPASYCTAGTSTNGCTASIAASANPSISLAHPCILTVTGVEGVKSGMLFYGIDNSGFTPGPWASSSASLLCVKHPTQRTGLQHSGGTFNACDGAFVLDWNAFQSSHAFALGNPWIYETLVYAQAWFRDPPAVKSTNLSDALLMTYVP
jgi:Tol biopolymer transport system component